MRKIVLAAVAITGVFALSACKGEEAAPAPTETASEEVAADTAAATDSAATEAAPTEAAASEAPKM